MSFIQIIYLCKNGLKINRILSYFELCNTRYIDIFIVYFINKSNEYALGNYHATIFHNQYKYMT